MKRVVVLSVLFVGVLAVAFSVSQIAWGKAHVPVKKAQVCHRGRVITVGEAAVPGHVVHGDCHVPACSSIIVLQAGDDCSDLVDDDGDGRCDGAGAPVEGSPGCPVGGGKF